MLTPKYDTTSVIETLEKKQTKTNEYYDQNTDHLSDLLPNQEILMQIDTRNWTPTKVIKESDSPESYQVQTLDGNQYRRNRIHLKRMRTPTRPSVINDGEIRVNDSKIPKADLKIPNSTSFLLSLLTYKRKYY